MTDKNFVWKVIAALLIILIIFVLVLVCRFAFVCAKYFIRSYQKMKQNGEITLINKKVQLMILSILCITLIIFALRWNHAKARRAEEQEIARQIPILLAYIEEHNGEVFDYDFVTANLGIPRKQIFKLLSQLKDDGKIENRMQYLRHPILLSDPDYMNFYWRVYIAPEKHPSPELGDQFPEESGNP